MDEITIAFSLGGIIIGAIITFLVSKYFFRKSIKEKTLKPFIQFESKLFSELDPELKEDLIVKYKNHNVDNIIQAQFLVANSGDIPIRDIIEPLRLTLPKENRIFSVNIVHIEPDGREIKHRIVENELNNIIEFKIPLLNGGDFFVFKILVQDKLPEENEQEEKNKEKSIFNFSITADDLPPKLKVSHLPYSYYEEEKERKYDWMALKIAFFSGLFFTIFTGALYAFKFQSKGYYIFSFSEFFSLETFSFYNVCIIFLALLSFISLLLMTIALIGAATELKPEKKPKFRVPKKLRKDKYSYPFEIFDK